VIILAPQDPGGNERNRGTRTEASMASAGARSYNGGLGRSPQLGPGACPGQGVSGAKPP